MNKKQIMLGIGSMATIAAPVISVISCGSDKKAEAKAPGTQTPGTQAPTNQAPGTQAPANAAAELAKGTKVYEGWKEDDTFTSPVDAGEMKQTDDSALKYIINDETLVDTNLTNVTGKTATDIINGTKKVIEYYLGKDFADNRVEFQVVEKVDNVFKIRENQNAPETTYTNDKRKVDVYGYSVTETGPNNKLKLIGSSVTSLAHAFYLYGKQHHYGLVDWADARGGNLTTIHEHASDLKRKGNSLVWPGTAAGRAAKKGEALATTTRVVARSPYQQHFNFNNVTSAYTMAYWDKSQWLSQLNWLAVHGYDLILDPVGTEAVFYNVWAKALGYENNPEAAWPILKRYFTGPTFASWQRKGNMVNYDIFPTYAAFKAWNDKQVELQRFIVAQGKARGITTIAQGFSGFVPKNTAGKTLHFGNDTVTYKSQDLYTTHWSIGEPSSISHSSEHSFGEQNDYNGKMLDPSILATGSKDLAHPKTAYQLIGNAIVNEYERLILGGEHQDYFNEDPFDEMKPMATHADGSLYSHDLFTVPSRKRNAPPAPHMPSQKAQVLSGKQAFLADLGYGLSQAVHGDEAHKNSVVTNISWQYTYMREDWNRKSFQSMIVGHDQDHPNFTPANYLILSLGEDWNRMGSYGMGGDHMTSPTQGTAGYSTYKDTYDFAFYAGFQDYGTYHGAVSTNPDALHTLEDTTKRNIDYDYNDVKAGGGSWAYVPLVCLGSGNLPDGELNVHLAGLTDMFYNIGSFPGGAANTQGKRPLLDNLRAYGPGMEGFEQNEIIYEAISDMGWRQEPFNVKDVGWNGATAHPASHDYDNEENTRAIEKAWLANYAWNRYGFGDQDVTDFLFHSVADQGGLYYMTSGNPRHAFQLSFYTIQDPWQDKRESTNAVVYKNYDLFKKVAARHQNDEHINQLFKDDLSLYAMDYIGIKIDIALAEIKRFIDAHSTEIQVKGSTEQNELLEYIKYIKWGYRAMDKLMADTTLWRLDRWVDFAREWGTTDAEKKLFEDDAKRILTVWGPNTVSDYASRAWSGLIKAQGMSRLEAFGRYMHGQDPTLYKSAAQTLFLEDEFITPVIETIQTDLDQPGDQGFFSTPYAHPYDKALQLMTIASSLDSKGLVTASATEIAETVRTYSFTGSSTNFKDHSETGGLSAPLTMAELDKLRGKILRIKLTKGIVAHIDSLLINDSTGKNRLLTVVNKDVFGKQDLLVEVPKDFKFNGGNNGDLTLVIQGGQSGPAPLSAQLTFDVTAEDALHFVHNPGKNAIPHSEFTGDNEFTVHFGGENGNANTSVVGYLIDKFVQYIEPDAMDTEPGSQFSVEIKERDGHFTLIRDEVATQGNWNVPASAALREMMHVQNISNYNSNFTPTQALGWMQISAMVKPADMTVPAHNILKQIVAVVRTESALLNQQVTWNGQQMSLVQLFALPEFGGKVIKTTPKYNPEDLTHDFVIRLTKQGYAAEEITVKIDVSEMTLTFTKPAAPVFHAPVPHVNAPHEVQGGGVPQPQQVVQHVEQHVPSGNAPHVVEGGGTPQLPQPSEPKVVEGGGTPQQAVDQQHAQQGVPKPLATPEVKHDADICAGAQQAPAV